MITLSVIKADIGGYMGHSSSHPLVIEKVNERLDKAKCDKLLVDFHITRCGDDLQLIMTHERGEESNPSRFDGPPKVIAAGFQLSGGNLVGPRDMFDDLSFDKARRTANDIADYMRSHGPFEPHRLPLEEMEYTSMPQVMRKLEGRFVDL